MANIIELAPGYVDQSDATQAEVARVAAIADSRDETIKELRRALKERTGRAWSVRGGRGTAWGWIDIAPPPARLVDGEATQEDRDALAKALALASTGGGVSIPASREHRREYLCRANGLPFAVARAYWD